MKLTAHKLDPAHVLAKAVFNLLQDMKISKTDFSEIIHQSPNTVTRIFKNQSLEPKSAPGELALLLIRMYRALFALNGGNKDAMIHWLNTHNHHIQGVPLIEMKSITGLVKIVNYLDAMRGKV